MTDEAAAPLDPGAPSAPEAAPVATPAPAAPQRSVTESLAATFDAIQKREGNAPGQRGADGKFQPQAPVAAAATIESTDQPATDGTEPAKPAIEAPQSWSAEMRAKFATLPPEAQQYVAQRENEAHAKISEQGSKLASYDGLSRTLEPHRTDLMAAYGSVEKGVNDLLALRSEAIRNPVNFLIKFAEGAGIRLDQLPALAAQAPQAQPVDPRIAALSHQVESLTSIHRQQALDAAQKQVEAFKADPKNKHYAAAESRIAELLNSGAAKDLADAYEQAVWGTPQLRELVIAERAAEAKAKADAEAKKLADAARAANVVNIRTSGGRAAPSAPSSIRESLVRAYDRVNGAA